MLMVISPAKTLDFDTPPQTEQYSQCDFLSQSRKLMKDLQTLAPQDLSALMKISDKLGTLNYERNSQWKPPFKLDNAKQAVLAFKGDVYTGLQAEQMSDDDLAFAQDHLRILSGLYGLLRPLDLIQAYRLEMGTPFANERGKNLYEFWDTRLTKALNTQLAEAGPTLLNLASQEYFGAVQADKLKGEVITPVFKDWKNGKYKIISFYAKKARGLMAAYVINNRIVDVEQIKQFDSEGYYYSPEDSTEREWVFLRDEAS